MQLTLAASTVALLAGLSSAQNAFSVSTPSSLIQCEPYQITWTGGVAPYYPSLTKAMTTSDIIENFGETSSMSYTWTVNQPVGDTFTINVVDSTGASAPSAVTPAIAAGSSSSCLSATNSSSSSSSTAASTGTASSAKSSTASSASASATSKSSNGANMIQTSSYLVAGAVGVVVAAFI